LAADWDWGMLDSRLRVEKFLHLVELQHRLGKNQHTKFMSMEIRELPAKATRFLVDGQPVNPWLVGIDFNETGSPPCLVELHLDLTILLFEMKQYGVTVTKDTIRQFVLDDIKNHGQEALDVYLTIVRHVVNPPPRRKNFGWFARMFTSPPQWTPPSPQWKWTSISEISVSGEDALVIRGNCYKITTL
jgi:hypothetical protein